MYSLESFLTNEHAQIYSKEFQRYESSRTSKFEHITTTNEPKNAQMIFQ